WLAAAAARAPTSRTRPTMRIRRRARAIAFVAALALSPAGAKAQTALNLDALQGLAPVSALAGSEAGKAALAGNLAITGRIQDGTASQPTLLPFAEQQQQALRDAVITAGNAFELADGLGSSLAHAYQSAASYTSADDGKTWSFTSISPAVARLIAYASATVHSDSSSGKYFFANATVDRTNPVSAAAMAILEHIDGTTDIFGKAYGLPAGSKGANLYGNSRPFQTEPHLLAVAGTDFFGVRSSSLLYLHGPVQDLRDSPSF